MKPSETLNNAAESNTKTQKQGFRKLKGVMAAVLLGATVAAAGIVGSAEPAQAGGRYYRSYRPRYSRVSYRRSYYYYPRARRCVRHVRYYY